MSISITLTFKSQTQLTGAPLRLELVATFCFIHGPIRGIADLCGLVEITFLGLYIVIHM